MLESPSSGKARSTWMTLPGPSARLPRRSPKPTSFSRPRLGCASGAVPQVRPHVVEHRAAHAEQAERVPVGEVTLLEREERACVAILIAQRVATQPVVATEQDLVIKVEIPALGRL